MSDDDHRRAAADDAWANAAHIVDADGFLSAWPRRAAEFRTVNSARTSTLAYGDEPRETLTLYRPDHVPVGLAVIVHGGYWLRFDDATFSHLATGALMRGWAVAMPSYPLAPQATVPTIGACIERAVQCAADVIDGPVRLAGHSAGGQLVTRLVGADRPLPAALRARIDRALSISGVHDLAPLLATSMNETLGLDEVTAHAASPLHHPPPRSPQRPSTARGAFRVLAWVGAEERPVFVEQTRALARAWSTAGIDIAAHIEPGRHHFDVIEDLERADSPMIERWLGD